MPSTVTHNQMANAIRALAMDGVERAKSGHPGMPMGMADVATVLWRKFLRFDATNPTWPDRDRFILSAGHGSMLLYALGYLTGYAKMTLDEIRNFRQLGSHTPGHPEHDVSIGAEMTTGPLGQGFATSAGFALGERILAARFGSDLVDHRTFVIASDGDLMEGISHEAASFAGHQKLGRLVVFYDDNHISIDGPTSLSFTEDVAERFRAYGWRVLAVDGHDPLAIEAATEAALAVADKPSLIACRTVIGFGAPNKQGTSGCHGSPLGADEIAAARKKLDWHHPPFEIPGDILQAWREVGRRGSAERQAWEQRLAQSDKREEFNRVVVRGDLPEEVGAAFSKLKQKIAAEKPKHATRQSSGSALEAILPNMPELIGGSADLTPSNNTQVKGFGAIKSPDYDGRYIHFGVREHAMAAAMNGMALHGGIVPYGGTFMQFADYCRPAIRLAALMKQRVVFVMTHDSIGLGEDGPTHQPVEHLAALRAIPNLHVFRPCDGVETAECWEIALNSRKIPSLLALSRQGLPTVRMVCFDKSPSPQPLSPPRGVEGLDRSGVEDSSSLKRGGSPSPLLEGERGWGEGNNMNLSSYGAYVLAEADSARDVTLLATGSEVALALAARDALAQDGVKAAVVSMPCWSLFEAQDEAYRRSVLGAAPRIAIEAGIRMGWERYIGDSGAFVGMSGFGASAPAEKLYEHFGITVDNVVRTFGRIRGPASA